MTLSSGFESTYDIGEITYPAFDGAKNRHLDEQDDLNVAVSRLLDRLELMDVDAFPEKHRFVRLFIGSLSNTFSQKNLSRLLHLSHKGYAVQLLLFDPFSDVTNALFTDKFVLFFANQDVFRINEALINGRKHLPSQSLHEFRAELNTEVFLYEQLKKLASHYRDQNTPAEQQVHIRYTHIKTESPTLIIGDQVIKGHFFYNNDNDHYPWIGALSENKSEVRNYFNWHFEKLWTTEDDPETGNIGSHSLLPPKRNVFVGYDRDIGTLRRVEKELTARFLHPMTFETEERQNEHIMEQVKRCQQYSNGAVFIMCNPNGDGQARSNVVAEFGYWMERCQTEEGQRQQLFSKTLLFLEKGITLSNWDLEQLESDSMVQIIWFTRDHYGNPTAENWAVVKKAIRKLKTLVHKLDS